MKRIFFIGLLLSSFGFIQGQDSNKPVPPAVASSTTTDMDSVDVLLNEARQSSITQEAPEVRPVSTIEFWLKKIGTSILVSYVKVKQYIAQRIDELSGSLADEVTDEKKDSN
jgi:hypothetical protein